MTVHVDGEDVVLHAGDSAALAAGIEHNEACEGDVALMVGRRDVAYTLERLAADSRAAMDVDAGPAGRDELRKCIEKACADPAFVEQVFGDNEEERLPIYEDERHGFTILAHVMHGPRESMPHDHGASWAIYGQAQGVTTMTDWEKVEDAKGDEPGVVVPAKVYEMTQGVAYLYNEGDLHSPSRAETTRLIRVEGKDINSVKRDAYVAKL